MPHMTLHDCTYYYEESGSGDPVLLLHGFTSSTVEWADFIDRLQGKRRLIAVDLPGHGRTDAPPDPQRYSMEAVSRDLAELCEALQIGPVHVVGYSMGARLALYLALFWPEWVRSVALESGSPGLKPAEARAARKEADGQLADHIEEEGIPPFVAFWERLPLWASQSRLPESVRTELRHRRLANSARGLANSLRGIGTGAQPSLWWKLPELDRPVLLLCGEEDPKFTEIARLMGAELPRAEVQIVAEAGHNIHLEQPAVFARLVENFWDRIT